MERRRGVDRETELRGVDGAATRVVQQRRVCLDALQHAAQQQPHCLARVLRTLEEGRLRPALALWYVCVAGGPFFAAAAAARKGFARRS